MKIKFLANKLMSFLLVFLVLAFHFSYFEKQAMAEDLWGFVIPSIELSDDTAYTLSDHTIHFDFGDWWSDTSIGYIYVQWGKSDEDLDKPEHLSLDDTTLGENDLPVGWSLNTSSKDDGLLVVSSIVPLLITSYTEIAITFDDVLNPQIEDCTAEGGMTDQCSINVTLKDSSNQFVATFTGEYQIQDEPYLNFLISGVSSNVTTNGVTTNISTNYTSVLFGNIDVKDPVYAAQELHVKSTLPGGYTTTMKMDGYLQGLYPANKIEPFNVVDVAWDTPKSWATPDGDTPNSDTGWIGANTSDTRVSGWSDASGKFGPVSSTAHTVMYSSTRDYGTDIYVTYALEVNEFQPADHYAGTIIYNITPTY